MPLSAKKIAKSSLSQGKASRRLATTTNPGLLAKQGAAVADVGAAPTQAQFNALLASLRSAGVIAP